MKVKVNDDITAILATGVSYAGIASVMKVTEGAVRKWHKGDRGVHPILADALKAMLEKKKERKEKKEAETEAKGE